MREKTPDRTTHLLLPSQPVSIAILTVVYLSFALTFSLLTRAYEADDEQPHTQYIEYIMRHDSLPHISDANNIESHQPPLYYVLASVWQRLLRIPAFSPVIVPEHYNALFTHDRLLYSHNYTSTQQRDAVALHQLRLLSILLGLVTVILTYAGAKVIGTRESVALAAGLAVALLPRELVVSSAVTNDALVIPLCALALLLFLLSERARATERMGYRRLDILGMGLTLGAAATTKFNSLPIAAILIVLAIVPCIRLPRRTLGQQSRRDTLSTSSLLADASPSLTSSGVGVSDLIVQSKGDNRRRHIGVDPRLLVDGGIAIIGFLSVSGWWLVRNKHLYGQFLATKASEGYLSGYLLHPVNWSTHLFFATLPNAFFYDSWYAQPNFFLPNWMNQVLAVLGVLGLAVGGWVVVADQAWVSVRMSRLSGLGYLGCIAGGLIAVIIVIKSTGGGDSRVALVGLSAIATVAVIGGRRLLCRINPRLELVGLLLWPTAFLTVDLYVLIRFLIPLGGL